MGATSARPCQLSMKVSYRDLSPRNECGGLKILMGNEARLLAQDGLSESSSQIGSCILYDKA
jgi:hypothetical protein